MSHNQPQTCHTCQSCVTDLTLGIVFLPVAESHMQTQKPFLTCLVLAWRILVQCFPLLLSLPFPPLPLCLFLPLPLCPSPSFPFHFPLLYLPLHLSFLSCFSRSRLRGKCHLCSVADQPYFTHQARVFPMSQTHTVHASFCMRHSESNQPHSHYTTWT